MTEINLKNESLEKLARKLGIVKTEGSVEYNILVDDFEDAISDALTYCNREVIDDRMWTAIKDLTIVRQNMAGNEGETSRSEGGVSQSFETGIPASVKLTLNSFRIGTAKTLPRKKILR